MRGQRAPFAHAPARASSSAGSAGAYLRSDDEALLDALLADRNTEPLQLLRIAPTVVVSRLPAARVLTLLRDADGDGGTPASPPG